MISFNALTYFSGNFWQFGWETGRREKEVSLFKLLHRASGLPVGVTHSWVLSKIEVRTIALDLKVKYVPFKVKPYLKHFSSTRSFSKRENNFVPL